MQITQSSNVMLLTANSAICVFSVKLTNVSLQISIAIYRNYNF